METRSKVSSGSEPPKKPIGVAIWQSGHQKNSNFPACKAQGNEHEIRIAFFERDYYNCYYYFLIDRYRSHGNFFC